MKPIILLPRWMKSLKMFETDGYDFDIQIGKLSEKVEAGDCVVGLSLGALIALKNIKNIPGKLVLINPPVPKRNLSAWVVNWLKFIKTEGLFRERQRFTRNPFKFTLALVECVRLLHTDFSPVFDSVSKERLLVIKGSDDKYFCDYKAIEFLNSKKIRVVEVQGGHNWCEGIEKVLRGVV